MILLFALFLSFNDATGIFLTIFPGPRQVAMGNAGVSLCEDPASSYYNPAGLAGLKEPQIFSMNLAPPPGLSILAMRGFSEFYAGYPLKEEPNWLPGLWPEMKYQWFGFNYPLKKYGNLGFSYTYLNIGKTEATDENGEVIAVFESYDEAISLSYGIDIIKLLSPETRNFELYGGFNIKWVYSFLAPNWLVRELYGVDGGSASSFTMDIGFQNHYFNKFISLGINIQNLSGKLDYLKDSLPGDPLPKLVRYGFSFHPFRIFDYIVSENSDNWGIKFFSSLFDFTYIVDYNRDLLGNEHETWECRGFEVSMARILYVRVGKFKDSLGERIGKTRGIGLNLGVIQFDIADDSDIYSFSTKNWRVSYLIKPFNSPIKNDSINFLLSNLCTLFFPGGAQLYRGEPIKGIPLTLAGFYLANRWRNADSKIEKNIYFSGIAFTYLISLTENILHFYHNKKIRFNK